MKSNSAFAVLRHIGGTAAIIADAGYQPLRKEKVEREQRVAQPLRSYLKRYRNNIAEYIRTVAAPARAKYEAEEI